MVTPLLWSLTLFDSFSPKPGATQRANPPKAVMLARAARGQLLICFIEKGMTESQVMRFLGRGKAWYRNHWVLGNDGYTEYRADGFRIRFDDDYKVDRVTRD